MRDSLFVAPIVEGHGDSAAINPLLRRVTARAKPDSALFINPALRVKAGSFLKDEDYFRKYIELAARKVKAAPAPRGFVLVLLDLDDDCPGKVGPEILRRAKLQRPDVDFEVVLAHREFETWFLAAANSLKGICGLPPSLEAPVDPERIRDAKGWLAERMGRSYNEPIHQPQMTEAFDLDEAAQVHSFARLLRKFNDLF
ncbi:MAG TPA: DUF4276 family protein [Verrucomicrobiae bacterium]|nr:DUF4276 family protein [Verrucomicrobiae bacterium]